MKSKSSRTITRLGLVASLLAALLATSAHANPGAKKTKQVSPDDAVLIYVDYLTRVDDAIRSIPEKEHRNNVTAFLKLASIFNMPAIVLGDEGEARGTFYPEVNQYAGKAPKFGRTQVSGYTPQVAAHLKKLGRKKVIIGGVSIDNCTLRTTLDLLDAGYEVYVVVDASGTTTKLAEDAAMMRMTQAGAVMTGWVSIAAELLRDWNSPYAQGVGKLYQDHLPR